MNKMTLKKCVEKYGEAGEYIYNRKKSGNLSLPWTIAYNNARSRCAHENTSRSKNYFGVGIKMNITPSEMKKLFFRDKAWELKCPSIDRIDPEGDYTIENTRWIDFSVNRAQRYMSNPHRKVVYDRIKKFVLEEFSKTKWGKTIKLSCISRLKKEVCY